MKRVCVFCGSRDGGDSAFADATRELGLFLVSQGCQAVYGGGRVGLMGVLADTMLRAGGHVIGVIPEYLATIELTHPNVPDMRVVGSMHERKALMLELSDAFVTLPGGFGTMEELFEVISWQQLRLHDHPVGVLNVNGFYDTLEQQVCVMADSGFLYPEYVESLIIDDSVAGLMERLEQSIT